ncbi:MAG: DNA adenine methylase [Promethearchaeota archaeon]
MVTNNTDHSIITTRYRGSKTKVIPMIWNTVRSLKYFTVLDCFGGTGAVSYFLKKKRKLVVYNDHLKFNHIIGRAIIENSNTKLKRKDLEFILKTKDYSEFPHLIENNFKDIYYTDEENIWLDRIISNLNEIQPGYKKDMGFWCLFQACITKRPFSLFHRKNLNLRLRNVERSFGNKTTWDTPFEEHFRKFADVLNSYVFDSGYPCTAINQDVMDIPENPQTIIPLFSNSQKYSNRFDLVYIDPPYIPQRGENIIYRNLYHFLEGITEYDEWKTQIDFKSKHRRLIPNYNRWNDKNKVHQAFTSLIKKFKDSILLISHRSDGLPSKENIISMLKEYKDDVRIADSHEHKYALSHRNSKEILILAQ